MLLLPWAGPRRQTNPSRPSYRAGALLAGFCIALLSLATEAGAADIEVTASIDQSQIAVGESVGLSIEISGAQDVAAPGLEKIEGFQPRYLGPSTQVSIVNGRMTTSISHRYVLVAEKVGQFQIGPFRVEHGGRSHESNALRVRVVAQAKGGGGSQPASAGDQLRLVLNASKRRIYVGERIPIEAKLYVGNVQVDDLQFPEIQGDGLVTDKLGQPARRAEVVGRNRYQTLTFATTATALRPGEIQLSAVMAMNVLVPRRGRSGGSRLFGDFFGGAFSERRPTEARAEATTLTVLPLPQAGRPAEFAGALGRFDFALSAKPTQVTVGDPVTVEMRISGSGDLSRVSPPVIPADDRFRAYDPLPVKEAGNETTRVFEQVLIPKEVGIAELPAVRFSYFDPEAGAYRTITRGPIPLQVDATIDGGRARVFVADPDVETPRETQVLGRDLVYIKDTPGPLSAPARPPHAAGWFWVLQSLPVAAFLALVLQARRRRRFAADPRLVRFRRAGRDVRKRLTTLAGGAAESSGFYDELSGAVREYLGAKLDLPPGAVERERVLERLSANGSSEDLGDLVGEFFELVESVRYASREAGQDGRGRGLDLGNRIVDRLERSRSVEAVVRAARAGLFLVLVSSLLVSAASAGLAAESVPEVRERLEPNTAFFAGNSAYSENRYADAIRSYEQIRAAGMQSGPLCFNLANAYFKDGQIGPAIVNYHRAKRLLPRDPDVDANLSYAWEVADLLPPSRPFWATVSFPLASRVTARGLAALATCFWFALWLCFSVRLYVPRLRSGLGRAAAVMGVLCALVTASYGYRNQVLEPPDAAVVTAGGETVVRFEPSESGTQHFTVQEGSALVITDDREGWSQVRREDGLRGWVRGDALTRVVEPLG